MKKTFFMALMVLTALTLGAAAVHVGAEAGFDYNSVIAGSDYKDYRYGGKGSMTASVPVIVEFKDGMGLETGLRVLSKKYDYSRSYDYKNPSSKTNSSISMVSYTVRNLFIELPLAFRASVDLGKHGISLFGTLGGFAGWWIMNERNGSVYGFTNTESVRDSLDLSLYNRFEAGVEFSLGTAVTLGVFDIFCRAQYSVTLTDMNKAQTYGSYPVHNSTLSVTTGLLWGFNK